jgi:predicted secreted protein
MTSSAALALGTALKRAGTAIAELTKIGDSEVSRDVIDVTNNGSAGWVEKIAGLKSMSDLVIEGNFLPSDSTGQVQLYTDFGAGTVSTFTITGPSGLNFEWSMPAFVSKFSLVTPVAESKAGAFKATLTITGAPSLTFTASADITTIAMGTGTLSPAYAASTYVYTNNLAAGTSSTFTVTKTGGTLTLFKDGVWVADLTSGAASSAVSFAVGTSKIEVKFQETGKVPKVYTIWVSRSS